MEDDRLLNSITIRPMQESDIDAAFAIESQSYSLPWSAKSFRYELTQSPASRLFAAVDDHNEILGYIATWLIEDELHINNIAVSPPHRRRHIAAALLEHVLAGARHASAKIATLEVRRSNEAAIALYLGQGFLQTGLRPVYYQDPTDDALILSKSLIELDNNGRRRL